MSWNLVALFDLGRENATPDWLREQLAANPQAFVEWVQVMRQDAYFNVLTGRTHWTIETHPSGPRLLGPERFEIDFAPRTLEASDSIRFGAFQGREAYRRAVRRVCLLIADLVGSARVIYTHECMPYDGVPLADKIPWPVPPPYTLRDKETALRTLIGPPAATFQELHVAQDFGPRAWYIDTFADLRDAEHST